MYGYSTALARIAELDSMMAKIDPDWQTPDFSSSVAGSGSFASVLSDVASTTSSSAATDAAATAVATATATDASGATDVTTAAAATVNPYYNTIYSNFHVVSRNHDIDFSSPLPGARLTQSFGPSSLAMEPGATVNGHYYAHFHNGIDLATKLGTPVLAAAAGTVIYARRMSDGAVVVKIRHDDGYVSLYGHLDKNLDVKAGDRVERGQQIGLEGMTGNTTGPHLHFALYDKAGEAVDPAPLLETGRLPEPGDLASPASVTNAGSTAYISTESALGRFDAVASSIPYASQIRSAAVANGVDPLLLAALVSNESSFHAGSVSSAGAIGLTQLMPKTASGMGVTDPYDPQQNLDGGAKYLALQIKRFDRIDMALAAYSKGPGTVRRAGAVPSSAKGYVRKVLEKWSRYEGKAS